MTSEIDCPCCKGSGNRYDTDIAEWTDETCPVCRGSRVLETGRKKIQAIGNEKKNRKDLWTLADRDRLKQLRANGITCRKIGILMGRTDGAVANMIMRMKWREEWDEVSHGKSRGD